MFMIGIQPIGMGNGQGGQILREAEPNQLIQNGGRDPM